ncbi:FUSC family protein [Thiocapsa imhoffii]|uniref:FUSC family protein n=1 Tax=Thiocapsa imhoffii TaxID=382777 RepID=UPI0019079079
MRLWSPTAVVDALKTSLGILIAWGIALQLQWPDPFMAPLAVLVLQTPFLGASLRKGVMRVLGTLAGAALALVLIGLFVQEPWILLTLLSLILVISVYHMRLSSYGYAWFMVALAVSVIVWDASAAPHTVFQAAIYRTSEAIIGILVVLVVNGILWPRTAGHRYLDQQRHVLVELAGHLRRTGAAVTSEGAVGFAPMPKALLRAPPELRELLAAAKLDSSRVQRRHRTYEAQIQALTASLGSMMGLSENLRLAAVGRRAFLTQPQRQVLREALEQLASALEAAGTAASQASSAAVPPSTPPRQDATVNGSTADGITEAAAVALAAAEACRQPLLTGPSLAQQTAGDSALAHALAAQLQALASDVERLVEASTAVGSDRALPTGKLPRELVVPWRRRVALAGPNALATGLAFWVLVVLWVNVQWPPLGLLAVVMAVVLIGGPTLKKTEALPSAKLTVLGFVLGILITAPIYLMVMPRLDGFFELALVLFPVYFTITYCLQVLPPPYQSMFLRIGILAIMLLNVEPQQLYSAVSYIDTALSIGTGFLVGVGALALLNGAPPHVQVRHHIKRLLSSLSQAQVALADFGAANFAAAVAHHDQHLRAELQGLSELLPAAYTPRVPHNDHERIEALGDALTGLVTRFRGLQQARLRWGVQLRDQGLGTSLGRQLLGPFVTTYQAFIQKLDHPALPASVAALDAITHDVRRELSRIDGYRHNEQVNPDNLYTLTIAGHYIAVMHALRELAAALDEIDWTAWRAPDP